ncbi:MAG: TonB-dependent receptor [Rubricoccaceae bacterium]|nr:TonB-dependent receptor [Rubricoccaceae bacterium]
MTRLLLPLALALLALPAVAQPGPPGGMRGGAVAGLVLDDASGEPIPSATVAVYSAADTSFVTGTITEADGRFSLGPLRPGDYLARISFVGYATETREAEVAMGPPVDLGEIRLQESAVELGEAEVEGQRELVEQRADRTVYNVAEQAVTAGGNALETLQTLPSLEVDASGNISLRGNQNVAIQINGRPVPVRGAFLTALLRQIPASNVERVEVIPNPSARYDPDGMSGIVNIVLLENTDRGLSGGFTLGGGTQPNAEAGANIAYQKGALDVAATYGFRYDEFGLAGETDRRNLVFGSTIGQVNADANGTASHFANGSLDYTIATGRSLTLEGSLGYRDGTRDSQIDYLTSVDEGPTFESSRATDGERDGYNGDAALVFRQRFDGQNGGSGASGAPGGGGRGPGRWGRGGPRGGAGTQSAHELALEGRFTRNKSDDFDLFTATSDFGDGLERSTADETNDETYLQLDYSRPLAGLQLETGAKATWRSVVSDLLFEEEVGGQFVSDGGRTNAFDYSESIYAAYLQGSRSLGPFEAQAGVRAETASRDFTLRTPLPDRPGLPPVEEGANTFDYTSLFPSAFLTYPIGEGTLVKASYSRRIERPRTFFLNPFPSFEDTLSVRVGNPQLRPEYTDAFELTLQYRYFLTVTPFYRHTTDVIRRRLLFDPETGVSSFTAQNLDTSDSYGSDVTLAAAFGPVRGFLSGSVYRSVTDGESVENGLASDAVTWTARGSVQYSLREGTDLQFFGFYRAPQDVEDGRISGFGFTTLGLNQKISDRLSLSLRVNDLFSTTRFEYRTGDGETFIINGVRDPDIQQVSGTLTWTFGRAPQRRPQPNQQPQQDDGFGL